MSRENIHTVFDRMAAKGIFRQNPANADSIDPATGQPGYAGPVPFPKMLYHPNGKTRITTQAEVIATPFGPKAINEQRALITMTVNNEAELAKALKDGWHEHPSDSVAAGFTEEEIAAGAIAPPKSAASRISTLEAELEKMRKELAAARAGVIQDDSKSEEEE